MYKYILYIFFFHHWSIINHQYMVQDGVYMLSMTIVEFKYKYCLYTAIIYCNKIWRTYPIRILSIYHYIILYLINNNDNMKIKLAIFNNIIIIILYYHGAQSYCWNNVGSPFSGQLNRICRPNYSHYNIILLRLFILFVLC